jgi:autotransporter-associated beta strand protein
VTINDSAILDWSGASAMVVSWNGGDIGKVVQNGGTVKTPPVGRSWMMTSSGPGLMLGGVSNVANSAEYDLNGGTLIASNIYNVWGPTGVIVPDPNCTAVFKFNGGVLQATQNDNFDDPFVVDEGSKYLMGNLTHAYVGTNGAKVDTVAFTCSIDQALEHDPSASAPDGGLTKMGVGTLALLRDSTYTGKTVVQEGTLVCPNVASLAPTALEIADSAVVALYYDGNQNIPSLKIGFIVMPDGVYGSSASPAPVGDDVHFAGTGTVTVGGLSGYAGWASTNAPTGTSADDFDGDGVSNGVEWVLGGTKDTNDLGKLPKCSTTGGNLVFTFQRALASKTPDTAVAIALSTNLETWTPYDVDLPPVEVSAGETEGYETVTLTVPMAPDGKKFARLQVIVTGP